MVVLTMLERERPVHARHRSRMFLKCPLSTAKEIMLVQLTPSSHAIICRLIQAIQASCSSPLKFSTSGPWLVATGPWLVATGPWLVATGPWLVATGPWLLATGSWLLKLPAVAGSYGPLAGGYRPVAGGYRPVAGGYQPVAGGYRPWLVATGQ
jgi:hypothetical protein